MTNKEMFDLIAQRLGNRTSTVLRATVVKEINEQVRFLDQADEPAWFQEEIWTKAMTVNIAFLDLPTDYIRDDDEGAPEYTDGTTNYSITKQGYNYLRKQTANQTPTLPKYFAMYGERVYFGPTPDKAYTFTLPYYKRTTVILDDTNTITNKWALNFFQFLTLKTIDTVARTHTRDQKLVIAIDADLKLAADKMYRAIEARTHAGREYLVDNEEK
jgi:hypothetical protein